jgi:hypothetical protein
LYEEPVTLLFEMDKLIPVVIILLINNIIITKIIIIYTQHF